MKHIDLFGLALVVALTLSNLAIGQGQQSNAYLLSPSKGQIPDDTGSDGQTRLTIEKVPELGGKSLKVVFATGDSFGDRTSRIKNWQLHARLRFRAFNPNQETVGLDFNINHKRTFNYQTRVVYPLKIKPGLNIINIELNRLLNVDGSKPDLANIAKWYVSCDEGTAPTLYFGDITLESASANEETKPIVAKSKGTTSSGAFRVRGTIGDAKVDLVVTPFESDETSNSFATVAGDPARAARIRAAKMPKIENVISFDTPEADAVLSAMEIFPANNPWNLVINDWPVHPDSKGMVASVGSDKVLRVNDDMCFLIVPPNQQRVNVKLVGYPDESDPGPYPSPDNLPIEGWPKNRTGDGKQLTLAEAQRRPPKYDGDRHAIIIDPVAGKLYEFFVMGKTNDGWAADQASIFDLKSNHLRPDGWTSADAAGLPIFPAVIRYDELQRGEIEHAMRFTISRSRKSYVYPATHHAGHGTDEALPRMGERFRLRQDFDTSRFSPHVKTILNGLKKYGMFVADNGIDWSLSMAPDPRIPDIHEELRKVKGSDFEVVTVPEGYKPPVE